MTKPATNAAVDRTHYEVPPERLRWQCESDTLPFTTTDELPPLQEFIGQDRALRAIEFGLSVEKPGYNIFVTGLTGTGKATAIKTYLEKTIAAKKAAGKHGPPDDWCYMHNFADPDRPRILCLPPGVGRKFRDQMDRLLGSLRDAVAKAFSSDEYEAQRREVAQQGQQRSQELFQHLEREAREQGLALQMTPQGVMTIPLQNGQPLTREAYMALGQEEQDAIEAKRAAFTERVEAAVEQAHEEEQRVAANLRHLDEQVAAFAVTGPFRSATRAFADQPEVRQYLDELRSHTLAHLDAFRPAPAAPQQMPMMAPEWMPRPVHDRDPLLPFRINVFVDHSPSNGVPIIIEPNPTWWNLFGKIERRVTMGMYTTDHTMLKPGSLNLASGGYLLLNIRDLLVNPAVWEALKRSLRNREVRLEDPAEQFGFVPPQGLRPQPMPLDVKVVVTGDNMVYQLLSRADEDFWETFKVKADFDIQIDRSAEHLMAYASLIAGMCIENKLRSFDRSGVGEVAEYGARLVEHQEKLSTRFGQIKDLLIEADYWAELDRSNVISAQHVQRALDEKVYRSNLIPQRLQEMMVEGTLMVDVDGAVVGQVNGLAVYETGDMAFGRPSRITAKTFMGRNGVVNIEREAQLSGKTHDKGVMILAGYLGWKYAQDKPLAVAASLCFEQSYDGIDGDSASSTELYAILSSLSGLPVEQGIAVTGSVNQRGEIQPIGGVNEKVEGFFDICRLRGLTGRQGVLIPQQNVRHLMLRPDVVQAVRAGQFHIYAVSAIDEGIAILTGREAGERQQHGGYPEGTINALVDGRLREMAEGLRRYAERDGAS